jgi:hypothetical protein
MTFCEKVCMPTATEDAKSDPGRRGTEGMDGVEEDVGMEDPPDVGKGRE